MAGFTLIHERLVAARLESPILARATSVLRPLASLSSVAPLAGYGAGCRDAVQQRPCLRWWFECRQLAGAGHHVDPPSRYDLCLPRGPLYCPSSGTPAS